MCRCRVWLVAVFAMTLLPQSGLSDEGGGAPSLRDRRQTLARQREALLGKIGLARTPVADLERLAKQQKQEYLAARDDCRKAQQAAIDARRAAVLRELFRQEKERSMKRLEERAENRRQMIAMNEKTIAANELQIETERKQLVKNAPHFATQESWDRYNEEHKSLGTLIRDTESLKARNVASQRVIERIEPVLKGALESSAAAVAAWQAQLNDALVQEKNTWDKQLDKWQRENDWARRVAAEICLGMDPGVIASMNPEMLLAELSPELQAKLMNERAEMYEQMANGVDEALRRLVAQAAEYQAQLAQLEAELRAVEAKLLPLTAEIIVEELPSGVISEELLQQLLNESDSASGYLLDAALRKEVMDRFRRSRVEHLAEVEKIVAGLSSQGVRLNCRPASPIQWNPETPSLAVTVEAEDGRLPQAIERLNYLCRRLCGVKARHPVIDEWAFPEKVKREGSAASGQWPFRSKHTLVITEPLKYPIQLVRTLRLTVAPPPDRACSPQAVAAFTRDVRMTGQIEIEVKASEFPTQIAGAWTGTLTILALNYGTETDQGCAMLESLKGKPLSTTCTLRPANIASGTMELKVTPPKGAQAGKAAQLQYQNNNGNFSARGAQGNGTMTSQGTFRNVNGQWHLSGTWNWAGKGATASGAWSVTNPNAR